MCCITYLIRASERKEQVEKRKAKLRKRVIIAAAFAGLLVLIAVFS